MSITLPLIVGHKFHHSFKMIEVFEICGDCLCRSHNNVEDERIFAICYFSFLHHNLWMKKKEVALWRTIFVDFVPTFVGVNFWCVYHILQYALCPRCKAILVE
jgi:hypothetical protein